MFRASRSLSQAILGADAKAEIPDVHIHNLRHTFASLLVSGSALLEMIGRLLGHTQIGTKQCCCHQVKSSPALQSRTVVLALPEQDRAGRRPVVSEDVVDFCAALTV